MIQDKLDKIKTTKFWTLFFFFFPYIKTEGFLWFTKHPLKFSHHDAVKQYVS